MADKALTRQEARDFLSQNGIYGSDRGIERLLDAAAQRPGILSAAAVALRDLKGGDVDGLDSPEVIESILRKWIVAGDWELAADLYEGKCVPGIGGGYKVVGRKQGLFVQGLKLASAFIDAPGTRSAEDPMFGSPEAGFPMVEHDRALYLIELGQLPKAEAILRSPTITLVDGYYGGVEGDSLYKFPARLALCDILFLTGRVSEAHYVAEMLVHAFESEDVCEPRGHAQGELLLERIGRGESVKSYSFTSGINPYAGRAIARTLQGRSDEALQDFKQAERFQQKKLGELHRLRRLVSHQNYYQSLGQEPPKVDWNSVQSESPPPLLGQAAIFYGLLLTRLGLLRTAHSVLNYNRTWAAHSDNQFAGMTAFADVALGDVYRLMGNDAAAWRQLEHPLAWSGETGQKEIDCWSHLSLARLWLMRGDLERATSALNTALAIAQAQNLALYTIDCQVTSGRIAFLSQNWKQAEDNATQALYAAADPECSYAWAQGNALHLLAELFSHPSFKQEYESDRQYLLGRAERLAAGASRLRKRIRDPRATNSEELLAKIAAQTGG